MQKVLAVLLALAAAYFYANEAEVSPAPDSGQARSNYNSTASLVSGAQIQGSGVVVRVLSDDNDGSRHQRFILELSPGRTVLVAHNIDLAPRITGIRSGDNVEFNGQYEANSQGGVIHWTHHDPQGEHENGWLRHNGKTYQ